MSWRALLLLCVLTTAWSEAADYRVREGDTLSSIAATRLGDSDRWRELAALNGITRPEELRVGQVLILPATTSPPPGGAGEREAVVVPRPVRAGDTALLPLRPAARVDEERGLLRSLVDRLGGLRLGPFLIVLLLGACLAWIIHALSVRLAAWMLFLGTEWGACLQVGLMTAAASIGLILLMAGLAIGSSWTGPAVVLTRILAPAVQVGLSALIIARVLLPPHRTALALAILASVIAALITLLIALLAAVGLDLLGLS